MKKTQAKRNAVLLKPEADVFVHTNKCFEFKPLFLEYLSQAGLGTPIADIMEVNVQLAYCETHTHDHEAAEKTITRCEEYIMKKGSKRDKAMIHYVRYFLYDMRADYQQAMAGAVKCLYLFRQLDYPKYTMAAYSHCGIACKGLNLYAEAVDHLTQAEAMAMLMGQKKMALIYRLNINEILPHILPIQECIETNEKFLPDIREVFGDEPEVPELGTYMQLAQLHIKAGQYDRASEYSDKSLATVIRIAYFSRRGHPYSEIYALKAEIAAYRGEEEAMCRYLKEYKECIDLIADKIPELRVMPLQFRFYLQQKNISRAKELLDEAAATLSEATRDADCLTLNECYCQYYNAIGDVDSEMKHFKIVHEYKVKALAEPLANRTKYMSAVYELEMAQKDAAMQKKELDSKTQELSLATLYLQQRNDLLSELQESIDKQKKEKSPPDAIVRTISEKIKQAQAHEEAEKVRFKQKFDDAQREFIAALRGQHTTLSKTEGRICALLRSGFETKEIAQLLSTSARTIENHRVAIRRKMNLSRADSLNMILERVG